MKKVVGIALIILVLAGGYYLWKSNTADKSLKTENSAATTNPAPSDDWKTYTNSSSGFSIKYPNNLSVDLSRSSANEVVFDTGFAESRLSIKVAPYNKTASDWLQSLDQTVINKTQSIKIDGQTGVEFFSGEMGGTSGVAGVVYKGNLYTFNEVSKMEDLGMLETFKFSK